MDDLEGILRDLVAAVPGAEVAAIGSMDGLLVERHPEDGADLATAAAELTNVLIGLRRALGDALEAGETQELSVVTEARRAHLRVVTRDLYLVVLLPPTAEPAEVRPAADAAAERVRALLG